MLGRRDGQFNIIDSMIDRLIPKDDPIRAIRNYLDQVIRDDDYASMYPSGRGRPSFSPAMMVKAMLWQYAEELSDRELETAIRYDLRLKFLLGLHLEERGPDASTLVVFRQRLLENEKARAAFDSVLGLAIRLSILKAGGTALIDATEILSKGEVPSIIGLVQQGIRKVLLAWRDHDEAKARAVANKLGIGRYLERRYNKSGESLLSWKGKRLFSKIVAQAEALLEALPPREMQPDSLREAADILEQIVFERAEHDDPPPDRIATATDPEARWGAKSRSKKFVGHKATILEDAESELIIGMQVGKGNETDDRMLPEVVEEAAVTPSEVIGDGAYGTRKNRLAMRKKGVVLVAPRKDRRRGRAVGRISTLSDRRIRARVERKQAEIVRFHGLRRARYFGLVKVRLQAYFTAAAVNLKRIITLMSRRDPVPVAI